MPNEANDAVDGEDDPEEELATLRVEYTELGEHWRHNENVGWVVAGLMVPAAGAAIAKMLELPDGTARHLFGGLAILAATMWVWVQERLRAVTELRAIRAREIERLLGMKHHRRVHEGLKTNGGLRFRFLWWVLLGMTVAVVACAWHPDP